MGTLNRLPREEATGDRLPADAFPDGDLGDADVEGHGQPGSERLGQRLPGTGGDFRRPSGGGELTDDDVEGHGQSLAPGLPGTGGDLSPRLPRSGGELAPGLPGTGGDFRRPSGGGEIAGDGGDPA